MSETTTDTSKESAQLDSGGAYELIRNRLSEQGRALGDKLAALNQQRVEAFGSTGMEVIGRSRIRTANNCVPRDIKEFGPYMLFGYNVFVGLRAEVNVDDVFTLLRMEETEDGIEYHEVPEADNFLHDPRFIADFKELYRYYKEAFLSQLRAVDGKRLAIFQTGKTLKDIKVFRWSLSPDGKVEYIDNRGERDNIYPPSHDFAWRATTRDNHIMGAHPHVSIEDEVFVETVGGDLTVKIENNTENGLGIYSEPVDDPHQSLADAQIFYARAGSLLLLKIRPYKEEHWRYLVYNPRLQQVVRLDPIGTACIALPEDHGIIFPGGYYLQSGDRKLFDGDDMDNLAFKRMIRSPNGEDVLYVFHEEALGVQVLYSYNLIRKQVQTPLIAHGFSIFDDGRMVVFRADDDTPVRVHPMQIWQTPYVSDVFAANVPTGDSFLAKLGNAELVRGISDAYSIKRMLDEQAPTRQVYEDLIAACVRIDDAYHWLNSAQVGDLAVTVKEIQSNAELIIDEFEKVQALRRQAAESLSAAEQTQQSLLIEIGRSDYWEHISEFTDRLNRLRSQRGHLIGLRERRYIDLARVEELEAEAQSHFDQLSQQTATFLLERDALQPYHSELDAQLQQIAELSKSLELEPLRETLDTTGEGLDVLTQILGELQIDDADARTRMLEEISEVYAKLNRAKAEWELKRKSLLSGEARAEFAAQFKLFSQSVTGAMALADTPDKADEQLSRLMVQLEELEGRFSEFDEFLVQIADKRDEVYSTLETRKQQLLDERQQRAQHLSRAADRILQGIIRRAASFSDADEQNAYFAADAMVLKVRDIIAKLQDLGDSVRADDIESQLKSARDQAGRELRDRKEIYADGGALIQFGKHKFSVNTQELDLTLLPREEDGEQRMALHLSGTDYFEIIDDPELDAARPYWQQRLVSETDTVYRAEYLAAELFFQAEADPELAETLRLAALEDRLLEEVRRHAAERYDEGYERGVHDADAAQILAKLLSLNASAGLLRYAPGCRGLAQLFWAFYPDREQCQRWETAAQTLRHMREFFDHQDRAYQQRLRADLAAAINAFAEQHDLSALFPAAQRDAEAAYLLSELATGSGEFSASGEAFRLSREFLQYLEQRSQRGAFEGALNALQARLADQYSLIRAWLGGYAQAAQQTVDDWHSEAAVILLTDLQG